YTNTHTHDLPLHTHTHTHTYTHMTSLYTHTHTHNKMLFLVNDLFGHYLSNICKQTGERMKMPIYSHTLVNMGRTEDDIIFTYCTLFNMGRTEDDDIFT